MWYAVEMRVITFCNTAYLRVLDNWVRHIVRFVPRKDLLVYALDKRVERWCNANQVEARLEPCPGTMSLWQWRMVHFARFARSNQAFIHSDVDALWLGHVYTYIRQSLRNVDIAISQGRTWPDTTLRKWGFVLCMGFFYVRPSPRTRSFFENVLQHMRTETDDQRGINTVVDQTMIQGGWVGQCNPTVVEHWTVYDECVYTACNIRCGQLTQTVRVALLPWRVFTRGWPTSRTLVTHPPTPKNATLKKKKFQQHNLWLCV